MRLFTVSVVYVHRAKGGGGGEGLVDDMYFTQVYVQRVGAQERKRDRQRETDCKRGRERERECVCVCV